MTLGILDIVKKTLTGEEILYASESIRNERIEICLKCEDLNRMLKTCKICHCPIYNKVRFAECECPKQKWLSVGNQSFECFEETGEFYFRDSRMKFGPFFNLETCKNSVNHYIESIK